MSAQKFMHNKSSTVVLGLNVEAEIQILNGIYPASIENKLAAINFALYEVATFFLYRYWYTMYSYADIQALKSLKLRFSNPKILGYT